MPTERKRLYIRLPVNPQVKEYWSEGPGKRQLSRLVSGITTTRLKENGHSIDTIDAQMRETAEDIIRKNAEFKVLQMKKEGLMGIRGFETAQNPPPPRAPPPPKLSSTEFSKTLERLESEFAAAHRGWQRSRISRARRRDAALAKCADMLEREQGMREQFPTPEALLNHFVGRILL